MAQDSTSSRRRRRPDEAPDTQTDMSADEYANAALTLPGTALPPFNAPPFDPSTGAGPPNPQSAPPPAMSFPAPLPGGPASAPMPPDTMPPGQAMPPFPSKVAEPGVSTTWAAGSMFALMFASVILLVLLVSTTASVIKSLALVGWTIAVVFVMNVIYALAVVILGRRSGPTPPWLSFLGRRRQP